MFLFVSQCYNDGKSIYLPDSRHSTAVAYFIGIFLVDVYQRNEIKPRKCDETWRGAYTLWPRLGYVDHLYILGLENVHEDT